MHVRRLIGVDRTVYLIIVLNVELKILENDLSEEINFNHDIHGKLKLQVGKKYEI